MGRLPLSGNKMRKIKIGTTVQETTAAILEEIRRNNPESIRSTGEVIDYLCNLLAELTPRAAKVVDEACAGEVQLITNEMRTLPLDGSEEMSFSQKELEREQLQRLHKHFSQYRGKDDKPQGMKRVDLLGGDYAVFPSSWVLLEHDSCAASCSHHLLFQSARCQLLSVNGTRAAIWRNDLPKQCRLEKEAHKGLFFSLSADCPALMLPSDRLPQ